MEYKPLPITRLEFEALKPYEKTRVEVAHWERNRDWFYEQLAKLHAKFLVVGAVSGKIYLSGISGLYPNHRQLETILQESVELPFAWSADIVSDSGKFLVF